MGVWGGGRGEGGREDGFHGDFLPDFILLAEIVSEIAFHLWCDESRSSGGTLNFALHSGFMGEQYMPAQKSYLTPELFSDGVQHGEHIIDEKMVEAHAQNIGFPHSLPGILNLLHCGYSQALFKQ